MAETVTRGRRASAAPSMSRKALLARLIAREGAPQPARGRRRVVPHRAAAPPCRWSARAAAASRPSRAWRSGCMRRAPAPSASRGSAVDRAGAAGAAAAHEHDFPGPLCLAQSALAGARPGGRADPRLPPAAGRMPCASGSARCWHQVGLTGGRRREISARVQRRPAAAHLDRARLSSEPDFLVCDEPTSALDVSVQAQILNLMRDLQAAAGPDLSVHQPQPGGGAPRVGPAGRDVSRPHRRAGAGASGFATPLHPYTRLLLAAVPDLAMIGRPARRSAGRCRVRSIRRRAARSIRAARWRTTAAGPRSPAIPAWVGGRRLPRRGGRPRRRDDCNGVMSNHCVLCGPQLVATVSDMLSPQAIPG